MEFNEQLRQKKLETVREQKRRIGEQILREEKRQADQESRKQIRTGVYSLIKRDITEAMPFLNPHKASGSIVLSEIRNGLSSRSRHQKGFLRRLMDPDYYANYEPSKPQYITTKIWILKEYKPAISSTTHRIQDSYIDSYTRTDSGLAVDEAGRLIIYSTKSYQDHSTPLRGSLYNLSAYEKATRDKIVPLHELIPDVSMPLDQQPIVQEYRNRLLSYVEA